MGKNFKKVAFQVIIGSVFALGAVGAAFSVAVSEKMKMEAASPSEQMAKESNELSSKIAGMKIEESNRVSLLQKKAEYADLMAEKATNDAIAAGRSEFDGESLDWTLAAAEYNCQIDHKHVNEVAGNAMCTDEPSKYSNPKVNG